MDFTVRLGEQLVADLDEIVAGVQILIVIRDEGDGALAVSTRSDFLEQNERACARQVRTDPSRSICLPTNFMIAEDRGVAKSES